MRLLTVGVLVILCGSVIAAKTAPEWSAEKHDLNAGSYKGMATIAVDKSGVTLGEKFSVDIRFFNDSGGEHFYNPFFQGLVPLPARLAIYSADHRYIGDLLYWEGGSRRTVTADDWTFVPSECCVGCSKRFTAGYVPGTAHGVTSNLLPPGDYYLQMIYFKAFVATNPARMLSNPPMDEKERLAQFEKTFDRVELFRSNVVTIQFTAK